MLLWDSDTVSSLFLKLTQQKRRRIGIAEPLNEPPKLPAKTGFYKLNTFERRNNDPDENDALTVIEWNVTRSLKSTWMEVSLSLSAGCFLSQEHIRLCFWVVACVDPCWEKRSRPPLRSPILLGVHASPASSCGPAEMWTGLARTKCFHLPQGHPRSPLARRRRANMSGYWPGTLGPPGEVTHSEAQVQRNIEL